MLLQKISAWHQRHHQNCYSACLFRRISRKLELDTLQQAKFENLQIAWNKTRASLQQIHHERDDMLAAVILAPAIDQDELMRMAQIPQLSFNEEMPWLVEIYSDFHSSLSQDQREKLHGLWKKRRQRLLCRH